MIAHGGRLPPRTAERLVSMRVLLVEDEPNAALVLAKGLREQAYAVDVAADGDAAIFQAGTTDYDAVILDVMLPVKDGVVVCRTIRDAGCAVPILMVTARDAVEARIDGLDSGADDYLVKPFDFGELLARLRALIRRGRQPLLPQRLAVGPLVLDTRGRRVQVRDRDVSLTAKEYALLEYLARRAGDVVSRGDIAEHVWDEHYDPLSNVVDVYVQRLRRKIDRAGAESLIRTRRGDGYQLATDPERA
jgi:two-component system copper resistance phosphate regulon response regulator CusR